MDNKDLEQELNTPVEETPVEEVETVENEAVSTDIDDDESEWQFDGDAPTISDDKLEGKSFEIDASDLELHKAGDDDEKSDKDSDDESDDSDDNVHDDSDDDSDDADDDLKKEKSDKIVLSKKSLRKIPLIILAAILAVLLIILGVKYFTQPNGKEGKLMNPPSVIAVIDGEKVSSGMYSYYYSSMVDYYEQYASYGYYDLDVNQSYDNQYTTDDDGNKITWTQFFRDKTMDEIKEITAIYHAAKKAGVGLTDAQKETIEDQITKLKDSASQEGISLNEYITNNFGAYCTVDTIEEMLDQYYITVNYKGKVAAETQFDDKQINEYFEKDKTKYYKINFSYIATEYDTTDDKTTAQSEKKVKDIMSKVKDRQSIIDLVPVVYKDYIEQDVKSAMESDSKLTKKQAEQDAIAAYEQSIDGTITGNSTPFGDDVNNWLFSDDTKIGSTNYYVDKETGYAYILLKTEMAVLDDEDTYSVRHILITPESSTAQDETGEETPTYTEEEWNEAKKKADKIVEEFNAGDKSEYSFALLAEENTADTASISSGSRGSFGGLYEGVTLGSMVSSFEEWSLDKERKYGDVDIVKSDYGWHIMFFINHVPNYQAAIIQQIKTDNEKAIVDGAKVKIKDKRVDAVIEKYAALKIAQAASIQSDNQQQEVPQN